MAVIKMKPTSPGRRGVVKISRDHLYKGEPFAPFLEPHFHHATTAWGSWFHFDNSHDYAASPPRLSS